jgi:cardiolipin synthase
MLTFVFAPGIGLLVYVLFGRDGKAFSRRSKLLLHDLRPAAVPVLSPVLSRQDEALETLAHDSAIRRRLMMLVRRNSRSALTGRNRVEIQQNAEQFYASLIENLKAARQSIHLQYFIWAVDPFTELLRQILIERARAGVEVRLLYDPIGSQAHVGRRYVREMNAAGGPNGAHFSASSAAHDQLPKSSENNSGRWRRRVHRRHEHRPGAAGWRRGFHLLGDTQVRFTGEAVAMLQAVFAVDWYNAVRENLFAPKYVPMEAIRGVDGDVPVQILISGPDAEWAAIRQLYAGMVVSAQRHVRLQSPFFIPDATLAEAVATAALGGVNVQVMVSARPSGNRLPDWAGNTFMADIVAAGVRVFLYQKGYLHAKTISIDSEICSIGSANIDVRSFSINYELNAVVYSERVAKELEADFDRDLAYCTEFDPAAYRRRDCSFGCGIREPG